MKPAPKPSLPRWLAPVLIALAAVLLVGVFSTELADTDAWWHLATGRYIVTHHRLPWPDPFAYTTAAARAGYAGEEATRRFNLTHEWLAQAALYLVYSLGGFGAVVLGKGLVLALLCLATGHVARRRTGSVLWGMAASLAAASLAVEFAHDRPSLVTFVFTALFIAIFEEGRWLWLLPPLALVWANCHGGFFLGWVVCGAYAAEAALRRNWRVVWVSGAAVLFSAANPNAFGVVGTLLRYRRSALTASLIEWTRADLWGPPWAFVILLYGSALVMALAWRRVRIADWLLFGAFAAAAISAFRNEMLIGLLGPILIAAYFPWQRRLPAVAYYAAAAALACAAVWGIAGGRFFQLRAAEWRFPAGAAQFLRAHGVTAPLFNTYEYGGYLIWRGQRVFIDGRALSETVFEDYRMIMGTPPGDPRRDRALARYGVGAMVVNGFEYKLGEEVYALVLAMMQPAESGWKLVYEDPQALIFVRQPPPGVDALDKRRIIDHLENECRLRVEHDPKFSLCARTLANFFLNSGDRVRARALLTLYFEHPYPDDPEARQAYLELLQQ